MKKVFYSGLFLALFVACKNEGINIPGYEVVMHEKGSGNKIAPGEYVTFEFDSYDGAGELLQSMRDAPSKPLIKIPTVDEAGAYSAFLDLMGRCQVGDSLSMFLPFDSIQGAPPSLAGQNIEYRVRILSNMNEEEYASFKTEEQDKQKERMAAAMEEAKVKVDEAKTILSDYNDGKYTNVTTTESGLKVVMLEEGRGENAEVGANVAVHYIGMLKDGTSFDDSWKRGQAFTFPLGQGRVIQGWDEGIQLLNTGAKALLAIPYDIAYGKEGQPPTIPAESDLFFVVELVAAN